MGHIGTSWMMLQRRWLNGFVVVHCRDAIHRVSKTATAANESSMQVHRDAIHRVSKAATAANESSMQVHGDAMNRVSTMGGDDVEWICGDIFAHNMSLNNRNMLYLHII